MSVKPCPEDIFCEAAWLMDELINADEVTNVKGLIEDLWSKAVSDIMNWTEKSIPLTEQQYLNLKDIKKVPEGRILAVGDNYIESVDSRDYGFVSTANVLGKALWK